MPNICYVLKDNLAGIHLLLLLRPEEATITTSDQLRQSETDNSSQHVHHARACEVNNPFIDPENQVATGVKRRETANVLLCLYGILLPLLH